MDDRPSVLCASLALEEQTDVFAEDAVWWAKYPPLRRACLGSFLVGIFTEEFKDLSPKTRRLDYEFQARRLRFLTIGGKGSMSTAMFWKAFKEYLDVDTAEWFETGEFVQSSCLKII